MKPDLWGNESNREWGKLRCEPNHSCSLDVATQGTAHARFGGQLECDGKEFGELLGEVVHMSLSLEPELAVPPERG